MNSKILMRILANTALIYTAYFSLLVVGYWLLDTRRLVIFILLLNILLALTILFSSVSALKPYLELKLAFLEHAARTGLYLQTFSFEDEAQTLNRWFGDVCHLWQNERNKTEQNRDCVALVALASQVAHDIRSPLGALRVVASRLRHVPEEHRQMVLCCVDRINNLANRLLQKSKRNQIPKSLSCNTSTQPQAVVPGTVISQIIREKTTFYKKKRNVQLHWNPPTEQVKAVACEDELQRILSNLIDNSFDALSERPGWIKVSTHLEQSKIILRVQDNGCGIPAEVLPRVFDNGFSYGKEKTSSGLGWGLYHAKTAVEFWGGKIVINSVENVGTTVDVVLSLIGSQVRERAG